MSLARAMTKRMKRSAAPEEAMPPRSKSLKNTKMHIDRAQISLPVALLSTTNTLVYDAPDLATMDLAAFRAAKRAASPPTSAHSADDSDASISGRSRASSHGSRDTLTDASSVESSPTSPAPNHLSGYFTQVNGKSVRKSASTNSLSKVAEHPAEEPTEPVPAIPTRALSHSKRAHVQLAHKRSINLSRGPSISSLGSLREHRSSVDIFTLAATSSTTTTATTEHPAPFAAELEQLNEVAEEFSGVARSAEDAADEACMQARGLARFCAADYMADIQPLFRALVATPRMAWI